MRNSKRENSLSQPSAIEESQKLSSEICSLQKKLEESQIQITEHEKKSAQISEKLRARETELASLQKEYENLEKMNPDERNDAILKKLKSDLEKKTKEIKNNEEEIEDLEDELSAVKKKLSKAKTEAGETSELLEKTTRKLKETEVELQDITLNRNELKEENFVQAETIEFVNAVLTAHPADDKDATLINNKVAQIDSIIKEQYIPLLKHEQHYANWKEKDDWIIRVQNIIDFWGNLQKKSWLNKKKVVAFIGEFSAGKTSIVNRILSQDDPDCPTLPVSSKATTAIATYISYGAGFLSQFTDANGDLKNLAKDMFLKVNKDILNKINASSLIRHFVMKYKNDNLKGLSILDTPGFSSNDEEDKDRTLDVIKEADALFWVMDANTGDINKTSLKIIAENIQDLPLYVIINKSDTKSPGELDKLEAHIHQTMDRANINVEGYIRFSKEAKLDELMKIIQTLKSKRTDNDIKTICLKIQSEVNLLNDDLKELRQHIRDAYTEINDLEDDISSGLKELKELSENVSSIPQLNSRWFHADDYRMDKEEYQRFKQHCEDIGNLSENIADFIPDFKNSQQTYFEKKDTQSEKKELVKSLKNILDQLMNTIKSFDSDLYKELTYAINNVQSQNKEFYQHPKDEDNDDYDDYAVIESPENNTSSQEEGYEAFQKALKLKKQNKNEEAKFWFIRAAKLGHEDAKIYCKKMKYK